MDGLWLWRPGAGTDGDGVIKMEMELVAGGWWLVAGGWDGVSGAPIQARLGASTGRVFVHGDLSRFLLLDKRYLLVDPVNG